MDDYGFLGQRIKATRLELGLKQQDLADAAGVSTAAISQVESGDTKNLKLPHLFAIADAMKVNPRWLAIGKGPRFMRAAILALAAALTSMWPGSEPDAQEPLPPDTCSHNFGYVKSLRIMFNWLRRLFGSSSAVLALAA